ncbi:DeoR/GlpR family DNA-binding transcription regulator [uncultured Clostridium sp.]|uniref:DeoR/GlpR family DNA-binding transcription regulator n=1 Tax=Clostridium sp. TaxID=1506 RepID=UPI0025F5A1A4|nr:DeoR/GlpR family DNA-binding transcription regulator [uncultured Clostridium sp.]
MFTEERHKYILDLLDRNGKIFVKDLSKEFKVSESMIRKDLKVLEKKNLLRRTYGGAINIDNTAINIKSFNNRISENIDLKNIIVQKAFNELDDNDTIFLDSSTTSFMIAKLIVENNKQLTIITNMFEIASLITPNIITKFIFIGGDYNSYVGGSIGSHAIEQINNYRCNKAFLGCTGIDLRDGTISTSLSEDAATKKAITNISDKLFLVTLNEKFKKNGSFKFSNLFDFYGIITEQLPDESITLNLKEYYINII